MSLIELLLHHGWHFIHGDAWITPDDRMVDGSEAAQWSMRVRHQRRYDPTPVTLRQPDLFDMQ